MQENRTLDDLFGDPTKNVPGLDRQMQGVANCPQQGLGGAYSLHSVLLEATKPDPDNVWSSSRLAYDSGSMDKFCSNDSAPGLATYAYVPGTSDEAGPYWSMAQHYVIADHMFPTEFGASFTGHLDLIAGNDDLVPGNDAVVDYPTSMPWGCDAPSGTTSQYVDSSLRYHSDGPFPCYTQFSTLSNVLDAAGVSWKYYAPAVGSGFGGDIWSEFDAIRGVRYSSEWNNNVISPSKWALIHAQNCSPSSCNFPNVAWIIPDWKDSDHATNGSNRGPSWVTSVVNTIHDNSYLWQSTAIIVVWDDWGGWYDHAVPPQEDFRGLGIRVPCLIISPFTHNLINEGHDPVQTHYEFGSILQFVEQVFGLPAIGPASAGYTDSRANSIANAFDFTLPPTGGEDISAPYPTSAFLNETPSLIAPDAH